MNKSIIYLGLLSAMFINSSFAGNVASEQQNLETEFSRVETTSGLNSVSNSNLQKPMVNLESESEIKESVAVLSSNYKKSIEETIEDDKKITESQEVPFQPLYLGTTIEDIIRIDNQIIESTLFNEVAPLDFELINKSKSALNNFEFKSKDALKS